ncbi:MAG TPA: M23 family metallopeptidase [Acidimicrobiales bacterium]|nr:M23 family metallopeptidase [Acidimicrobiales bacterium]
MLLVLVLLVAGPRPATRPEGSAAPSSSTCALPVDAEVSDGFRPPAEPWLPGNRGLTFATTPGRQVLAVTPGVVRFAGPIAGQWYVTVRRDDGRDVTYSFLSSVDVAVGDVVAEGDPLGRTGPVAFQLGYRDGTTYLDPTELVVDACGLHHAVLVPVPE